MKKFKKLLSLVLAMIMTLAMAAPSFANPTAVPGKFTITIDDSNDKNEYVAYQIFKGDLATEGSGDNPKYILSNIEWADSIVTARATEGIITALKDANLIAETDTTAAKIAGKISETNIDAVATVIAGCLNDVTPIELEYKKDVGHTTKEQVEAGYYLIKQTKSEGNGEAISKYMVQVVKNVDMKPKSEAPTVVKKIVASENQKVDVTSLSIGDNVTFEITATVPERISDYSKYELKIVDTLSDGLTYNNDAKITLNNAELYNEKVVSDNYAFTKSSTGLTFSCENIKNIAGIAENKVITLTYTARVNEDAIIGGNGNTNKVKLIYSNDPYSTTSTSETPEDIVWVFTYKLDGEKVDETDENVKLSGAKFILYRGEGNDVEYRKVDIVSNEKVVSWVSEADTKDQNGQYLESVKIESVTDGTFEIEGLASGIYYLKEIEAPEGYNLLADPIKIKIEAVETVDESTGEYKTTAVKINVNEEKVEGTEELKYTNGIANTGSVSIIVKNNKGTILPSTGGIGTTIFYAAGIILMAGAVFFVIRRKRA